MFSGSLRSTGQNVCRSKALPIRHASNAAKRTHPPRKPKSDVRALASAANMLIKGVKKAQTDPDWKHTIARKGEKERLAADVARKNLIQKKQMFDEEPSDIGSVDEVLNIPATETLMKPGTFFELRRSGTTSYGVVIALNLENAAYANNTLSMNTDGEFFQHKASDAMFSIPNFVDMDHIERCGKEAIPEDDYQLLARLKVLKKARGFERSLETETSRLGKLMDEVYKQVRAESPEEWGKASTMQVARILHSAPNVPLVTLFATHRQLMRRTEEYTCHPTRHRFLHSFDVRPLSHVENFKRVRGWIRERNPVISQFQQKAKTLVRESRKIAIESKGESASIASSEITEKIRFTDEDKELILFLKRSMGTGRKIQENIYQSFVPAILKGTDKIHDVWSTYDTFQFLQNIGVFTPWEDIIIKQKDLRIQELADETPGGSQSSSTQPQISGLHTIDPHESVRHDFGNLPVYVIDDVMAEELDDGISIESIPGQEGTFWLHVHVADPTSIIPLTHPLAKTIEKRSETVYLEHRTFSMLPRELTILSDLGREDAHTKGQRTMTFSAKIDSRGELLDYKLRAGIIRNVHKLKYDAVNEALGMPLLQYKNRPFEPSYVHPTPDITDVVPHTSDLRSLYNLSRKLVQNRLQGDYVSYNSNRPDIGFLDTPVPETPPNADRPFFYRGFPRLSYTVATYRYTEDGARSLVAECMKVAGRVASRFSLDNNVPVIRVGLPKTVYVSEKHRERVLAERDEFGFVEPMTILREGVFLPPSETSLAPIPHEAVGAREGEGYMRATSPLRRAEDMFNHWQMKGVLLPGGSAPLRSEDMERLIQEMSNQKLGVKKAYRSYSRHWSHLYIQRFMDTQALRAKKEGKVDDDFNPLRGMEGFVMTAAQYNTYEWKMYQDVYVPKLGLLTTMRLPTQEGFEPGTPIKVNALRVTHADLSSTLEVEPAA